ncbi:MAG: hypothetical protein ABIR70_24000 [Bryobacteraceae bacterium]
MEYLAAGVSSLMSVFILAVFVAGVMKLFQIHTVLTEIKDSLRSGSGARSYSAPTAVMPVSTAPEALHSMGSGDEMLRALDAQMKWDESNSRSETR